MSLRRLRLPSPAVGLGVVAGVYFWLALVYLPGGVYWTPDVGLKRLQAANVRWRADTRPAGLDLSIAYPGQPLDPGFKFLPFRENFYYLWQGRVYFAQPPIIAVLSQPFITAFDYRGEPLVPILAGLIAVGLVGRLATLIGLRPAWLAILLAGLATPLMVYSLFLWEHSLGVMLALGAVAAAVSPEDRRSNHLLDATTPALSGLLAGLAGCVRKELLLLALPLAVYQALPTGWRATRHWRRLAAWLGAFSLPLLAWWSYTFLHSADVIPPEFRISTQPELSATAYALRVGPAALADFVFDPRYGWLGDLLMVAVAAYGLANFRLPRAGPTAAAGWIREAIQVAALAAVLVGAWRTMAAPLASVSVFGLLSASPFLMLGWSEDTAEALRARALRWIGLSYYALMVLSLGFLTLAGPLQSGLEWGTRFGLLTFPLAAPLSLLALRAVWARARAPGNWLARVHLALAVALIAWSAAWQFAGVSLMRRPAVGAEVRSTLLSLPDDVILTNLWWLSAAVPDLYLSRPTFLTDSDQALREWLAAAQRGGVRGFAFISYVPLSESVAMALAPAGLRVSAAQPFQLVNGMIVTRYTLTPGLPD